MPERILITGASGFVGKQLVAALRRSRIGVLAGVRSISTALDAGVEQFAYGNLSSEIDWRQCLAGVDVVVHLAARAHVLDEKESDRLQTFRETNVHATMHLARHAVKAGVRRFVFVSSIGVNGNATHGRAFCEADTPAPVEPYAVSKAEAELALRVLGRQTGMEITIVRPVLVYGADAPGNFGRLLKLAAAHTILPLASIRNRRSLVFVDNLADLLVTCTYHPHATNETFLAADGEEVSTPDILRKLRNAMGKPARIFPFPVTALRLGAMCVGKSDLFEKLAGSLEVDIGKSRSLLKWIPPLNLDEGLARTAAGYLKLRGDR